MAFPTGPLAPILSAAASAVLQRTFFMLSQTPDGIPRILAVIDAVMEEDPEFTADVTQHAVERGREVSDHIQLKNPTLRLKGTISSTPLDLAVSVGNLLAGGFAAFTSSQFRQNILNTGLQQATSIIGGKMLGNGANALGQAKAGAADAIARSILLNAYELRLPFDVVTKRQRYENMVIQSLRFPRDTSTGYQLVFEVEMIHLRIVSPFDVQIDTVAEDKVTSATKKSELGNQSSSTASDQATASVNKSWLRQAIGAARG